MRLRTRLLAVMIPATGLISAVLGWAVIEYAASQRALLIQETNRSLAANLVAENILYTDGQLDPEALENIFHTLMVVNPAIEVYLLENDGAIYMHSAPEDTPVAEAVDLAPIRLFLTGEIPLPLRGTDPRAPGRPALFSAAPVVVDGRQFGYLYVVLGEAGADAAFDLARTFPVLGLVLGGVALLATVLAITVMRLITRRIERLEGALAGFHEQLGNPEAARALALPARTDGDEIDSVSRQAMGMSATILDQLRKLASTDRLRRQLIANVSHDLRTPLTALEGYLQTILVKNGDLDEATRRQYVETAYRAARRLRRLIVELFELSRLEAQDRQASLDEFCIAELASDVIQKLRILAERRGVELVLEAHPAAAYACGEIALIERAFDNLIVNAIQHSPRGGRVTVRLGPGRSGNVRVTVGDQGRGIAPEDLPYIFDRFYRPSASGATQAPGAGLGLAIVRRIMELHASRVEARSELGAGSTFSFWLPAAAGA